MKKTKKLELLEKTVAQKGYKLRYEKGTFLGSNCRLRDDNYIVINKFLPIEGKIFTIAHVLSQIGLTDHPPEVKKIIDDLGLNTGTQLKLLENGQ